ncbi:SixA phosphatase family protein [Frigidibacter sp. ROC022]|uniref:SixA phosphatase family protein n=1 Tax=Frigidibacter sp. ROC022 TaxID=2971796 RepID=UPI00215AF68A|nr:histidine phosphatase family protein [Frigidibacter sp. ROC022]MCR8725912.1 histidine phosphatase family protein [Frigidibacter sp. ROC022]
MTTGPRRRLILTRHAKSAWDDPTLDDHDRPLNARGLRAARELGHWLASRGYLPEEVLCSSARRTTETWAAVAATPLEIIPEVRYLPELYHASSDRMLTLLQRAHGDTVMMLGHNPGIAELAAMLPSGPVADADFRRYPTAATLVVDFQVPTWAEVRPGAGSVLDFFVPSGRT